MRLIISSLVTIALLGGVVGSGLAAVEDDGLRVRVFRNFLIVSAPSAESADARTAAALRAKVTCHFEDADMSEIASFFRRTTGVNIVLDPRVRASADIPPVTLQVDDMTARTAWGWVMRQSGLHWGFVNEAIYVSTAPVRGDTETRIYDVSDLISPVQDFPGPELAIAEAGSQGGIQDIFQPLQADQREAAFTVEDLAEMIEELFD